MSEGISEHRDLPDVFVEIFTTQHVRKYWARSSFFITIDDIPDSAILKKICQARFGVDEVHALAKVSYQSYMPTLTSDIQGEYTPRAEIVMASNGLDHRVIDDRITCRVEVNPFSVRKKF